MAKVSGVFFISFFLYIIDKEEGLNERYIRSVDTDEEEIVTFENFSRIFLPDDFANDILNSLKDLTLNDSCSKEMSDYCNDLTQKKGNALQMFDASSKLPSGVISGNIASLGAYDQCLDVKFQTSRGISPGQFCVGMFSKNVYRTLWDIPLEQRVSLQMKGLSTAYWAVCLPSGCTEAEVQTIMASIGLHVFFSKAIHCESKQSWPGIDGGDIMFFITIFVLVIIVIASTVYDVILNATDEEPYHDLLTTFSILTNGRKLVAVSLSKPTHFYCLDGLRVLSLIWIILLGRYTIAFLTPAINYSNVLNIARSRLSMIVLSGIIAMDTYYLVDGLLISYNFLSRGRSISIWKYYLIKYTRVAPSLAMVIFVYLTVLKHLGSGPLWYHLTEEMLIHQCRNSWWATMFFVQNIYYTSCVSQAWFVSVEVQLFLFAPVFITLLNRFPHITINCSLIFSILSALIGFVIAWILQLNAFLLTNKFGEQRAMYMKYYFEAPYIRASPWFCGFVLGYIIHSIKEEPLRTELTRDQLRLIIILSWMVSFAFIGATVFAGYRLVTSTAEYHLANALYIGLVCPTWIIAISWIILACCLGYGGPVNWFLSLELFQMFSKVAYPMYLLHIMLITLVVAQMRQAQQLSHLAMFHNTFGDLMVLFLLACLWSLLFEFPFIKVAKIMLGDAIHPAYPSSISHISYPFERRRSTLR